MWSNPGARLDRVPQEVLYALPPPMKAPFPQTAAEKRKKVMLSWAPLVGFLSVLAAVYLNAAFNPSSAPPRDYNKVPDFLMKGMMKAKAEREAAATLQGGKIDNKPVTEK
jgi:hypothetical protein